MRLPDMSQSELAQDLQHALVEQNSRKSPLNSSIHPLNVVAVEGFLQMQLPAREALLAPWLCTQDLTMIYAPRGIGKTHVALGIAYAVASGNEFLRWKSPLPRGVLYIDGGNAC